MIWFQVLVKGDFVSKILVLYYSRTGNTEKMAKAVAEGAKNAANPDVELNYHVDAEDLSSFDAIVMGAPTYHHDTPIGMKTLFEEAAAKGVSLKGKVGAAFGSYGWAGGATKAIIEELKATGIEVVEPEVKYQFLPDKEELEQCKALGKKIASLITRK